MMDAILYAKQNSCVNQINGACGECQLISMLFLQYIYLENILN